MKNGPVLDALSALAQTTRLSIFRLLVAAGRDGLTPGQMAEQLRVAPATLSFHLKELSHAELVTARHESRFIVYAANLEAMRRLVDYLTAACCGDGSTSTSPVDVSRG